MIEHLTPEEHPTPEEAAALSGLPQWAPEELQERLYQKDRIVQANRCAIRTKDARVPLIFCHSTS